MISFESDYTTGAHEEILRRFTDTNLESLSGYGADKYTNSAKEKIRLTLNAPDAQIEFLAGGTQTNAVVISTMLADYEGVIAAKSGHINVHEAGAIEYSGHKVIELPSVSGKIRPEDLENYLSGFHADENREHMVYPGMVYISHPSEYGTLYSKKELTEISDICHRYGTILYLDGARLAYGLMSKSADVSLGDIYQLCDVFYIGGTKCGALCGEAVIFTKENRPSHFLTQIKQRGALLAKGRLLGIQFDTLFSDDLYFQIGAHAIEKAEKLKEIFKSYDIKTFIESPTNQQFVILENTMMEKLKEKAAFSFWEKYDEEHTVVRFAASWSTSDDDLRALEEALKECL